MIIKMIIQSDLCAATPVPSHKTFYGCNLQFGIIRLVNGRQFFPSLIFLPRAERFSSSYSTL